MITHLTGDATRPAATPALIMHVCNDVGAWGRGFVLALSARWPEPEMAFRLQTQRPLGDVEIVRVEPTSTPFDVVVANMVAQRGISRSEIGQPPIRYDALSECLIKVDRWLSPNPQYTVHAPRIGCGLAGGEWVIIKVLINRYLPKREVYIYDLEAST
jgi:hypothetical protein